MSFISRKIRLYIYLQRRYQQTIAKIHPSVITSPLFKNVENYSEKIAIRDDTNTYTYSNIFLNAQNLATDITRKINNNNNNNKERILFLCPNNVNYIITLLGIWLSGNIAVPLSPLHPKNILLYYIIDTKPKLLITTSDYMDNLKNLSSSTHTQLFVLDKELQNQIDLNPEFNDKFNEKNDALILYTSGTTGNPKGVVLTHKNLINQVNILIDAWKWSQDDVLLHSLPLNHVHGIVNCLLCPLSIGAKVIMLPKFNANSIWSYLLSVNTPANQLRPTLFMGVPTMYAKLIEEYQKVFSNDPKMVEYIKNTLKAKIRLMVSGSAPLSGKIFNKWANISGHNLLERYGMTEIGMCLSNLYDPKSREPGYVGVPLPGVSIKLINNKNDILLECTNVNGNIVFYHKTASYKLVGELLVKSDSVFKEYYNRPDATKKEFTSDGWFKTGDICEYCNEKMKFKILGRLSTDIIKSGGYKLSALEIETTLNSHPDIKECVILGIENDKWGQIVGTLIVPENDKILDINKLKEWIEPKVAKYAIPKEWKFLNEIPKNTMGKINKKDLIQQFFAKD